MVVAMLYILWSGVAAYEPHESVLDCRWFLTHDSEPMAASRWRLGSLRITTLSTLSMQASHAFGLASLHDVAKCSELVGIAQLTNRRLHKCELTYLAKAVAAPLANR